MRGYGFLAVVLVTLLAGCRGPEEPTWHGLTEDQWVGLLRSEELPLVLAAFQVAQEIGVHPDSLAEAALPLLRREDPDVVSLAVRHLAGGGGLSTDVLIGVLEDAHPRARPEILKVLVGRGESGTAFLESRFRAGQEERREVIQALGRAGESARVSVPFLRRAIGDENPALRRDAYHALVAIGEHANLTAEDLLPGLADPDPTVRFAASWAAGVCGVDDPRVLRRLREAIGDPAVSPAALRGLAYLGARAREALPDVLPLLRHESRTVRKSAVETVAAIAEGDETAADALRERLRDPDLIVRRTAMRILVAWGKEAGP